MHPYIDELNISHYLYFHALNLQAAHIPQALQRTTVEGLLYKKHTDLAEKIELYLNAAIVTSLTLYREKQKIKLKSISQYIQFVIRTRKTFNFK